MLPDELIQKLIQECQQDTAILAVILFGSYARGENFRDIDICLVPYPNLKNQPSSHYALSMKYDDFSKKVLDISVFYNLPLYIQNRVIKEGQILLNKDYSLLFDLYIDTIKSYNLFEPHLNTYLKAVLDG